MTNVDKSSTGSLFDSVWAEFLKLYAFRLPQIAYVSIFVFLLFFVVQLFYVEHVLAQLGPVTAIVVMPYIFFVSWRTVLFQLLTNPPSTTSD